MLKEYCLALGIPKSTVVTMKHGARSSLQVTLPDKPDASEVALPRVTPRYLQIESEEFKSSISLGFTPENVVRTVLESLAHALLNDAQASTHIDETILAQWNEKHELTPIQLLEIYSDHLKREELNLDFDYHAFAIECSELMDIIVNRNAKSVKAQNKYLGDKSKLTRASIVKGVLLETILSDETGQKTRSLMLEDLGTILSEYCAAHGDKGLKGAEESVRSLKM